MICPLFCLIVGRTLVNVGCYSPFFWDTHKCWSYWTLMLLHSGSAGFRRRQCFVRSDGSRSVLL